MPVNAGNALADRVGPMRQTGVGGYVLPDLQRVQQVPGEDHTLPAWFGQSLFGQEVGATLHGLLDLAAKV